MVFWRYLGGQKVFISPFASSLDFSGERALFLPYGQLPSDPRIMKT